MEEECQADCPGGCHHPPAFVAFGSGRDPRPKPPKYSHPQDKFVDVLCEEQKYEWTPFPLEVLVQMEPDNADAFIDAMIKVSNVNDLLHFRSTSSYWHSKMEKKQGFWAKVQARKSLSEKPVLTYPGWSPHQEFPGGRMYCLPQATKHITPLHLAAFYGNVPLVVKLLSGLTDEASNPPEKETGWTPLHYAVAGCPEKPGCFADHLKVCQLIIDRIKSPFLTLPVTTDILRSTPLHAAASGGHLEMVKLMVDNLEGPEDHRVLDGTQKTPMACAIWRRAWLGRHGPRGFIARPPQDTSPMAVAIENIYTYLKDYVRPLPE